MKRILLFLTILININSFAQDTKLTNFFGIMPNYPFFTEKITKDANLRYRASIYDITLFYGLNYHLNKSNSLSGGIYFSTIIMRREITIPAEQYNLPFAFWDARNSYVPWSSIFLSYNRYLKNNFFLSVGIGVISAFGKNTSTNFVLQDTLVTINKSYDLTPSTVFKIETGRQFTLNNTNKFNVSLFFQYSGKKKFIIQNYFFPNTPEFSSITTNTTNLSLIGIKFSYEF